MTHLLIFLAGCIVGATLGVLILGLLFAAHTSSLADDQDLITLDDNRASH